LDQRVPVAKMTDAACKGDETLMWIAKCRWTWAALLVLAAVGLWWHFSRRSQHDTEATREVRLVLQHLEKAEANWRRPTAVNPEVVALIDQLTETTEEGWGTHSTAWASGFIGSDEEPEFRGGIIGSQRPETDPAMRALVKMGVEALPDLLAHASDPRKTKLELGRGGQLFGGTWYSDEFHPRYRKPDRQPQHVNVRDWSRVIIKHQVRVGDLCFVAIGQIVNRHLNVARYQPTACLVINSPIQAPELAEAVRQDWSNLNREQHQESLSNDALLHASYGALSRLYFYYPEVADAVAEKLLQRPISDETQLSSFVSDKLLKEENAERWAALVSEFKDEVDRPTADKLPIWLHWSSQDGEKGKMAKRILDSLYPKFDPDYPPFIDATTQSDRQHLVETLARIPSAKKTLARWRRQSLSR
jgi:hypothetical protein